VGNPVQYFNNQPTEYFLNFSETGGSGTQYLEVAVEFSGFIYVLSVSNSAYRPDIYRRDQTGTNAISTTTGFTAAKVTVDYWRNVYSLNYEVLKLADGSLQTASRSLHQWWIPNHAAAVRGSTAGSKARGEEAAVCCLH
jgi:hypothetical protein